MESYIVYGTDPKKGFVVSARDINHLRAKLIKDGYTVCHVEKRRGDTMRFDHVGVLYVHDITGQYVWLPGEDRPGQVHGNVRAVSKSGKLGRIVEVL